MSSAQQFAGCEPRVKHHDLAPGELLDESLEIFPISRSARHDNCVATKPLTCSMHSIRASA